MKYLKMFEMFDSMNTKVADMHHTPSSRKQFGLDKNDEEGFKNYVESQACTKCDCIPCQCTGEECEQCGCFPCECNEDIKEGLDDNLENTFSDWRINSYLKIARDKYNTLTSNEIITKINNGPRDMRFKNVEEEQLFKDKWDNEKKEGTFAYYDNMSAEQLRSLESTFKHDFDNPQHHNPKYVAYKKACQAKQVFMGKDQTPTNFKQNKVF
jgi:hypothetical protein